MSFHSTHNLLKLRNIISVNLNFFLSIASMNYSARILRAMTEGKYQSLSGGRSHSSHAAAVVLVIRVMLDILSHRELKDTRSKQDARISGTSTFIRYLHFLIHGSASILVLTSNI